MAHIVSISRDPLLLHTRCLILEGLGHSVSSFQSPEDATEFMKKNRNFDLLLLGHTLSRTEWSELAQVAKSSNRNVAIVALYCNVSEPPRCPPDCIPVLFAKPESLVNAVKKALEERAAGPSGSPSVPVRKTRLPRRDSPPAAKAQ